MPDSSSDYANRRSQFLKKLPPQSIAILPAEKISKRNGDVDYPFRQNSDFYYLTGFPEPDAIAVFIPGRKEGEYILFNYACDPVTALWIGERIGQENACCLYGVDQSFPLTTLDEKIPLLLENLHYIYYPFDQAEFLKELILPWLAITEKKLRQGIQAPQELRNIRPLVAQMRLYKSNAELKKMHKAATISAKAHCRAMQVCRPGLYEYALAAELHYIFTQEGGDYPAYPSIVGAGANACTLHYTNNNALIADGDLVLIDAGVEYDYYAADITRTFPANGRFTPTQRALYEAVLETQLAVIAAIKPNLPWEALQSISEQVLTAALLKIGILQGDLETLIANKACHRFYKHRIGHWLGMEVHDVGGYKDENLQWRTLQPGMVLTVEPGVYIPANIENVDPMWWNMGIRIEDDIAVTECGYQVLSADAPKTVAEIEACMAKKVN